jgi:hypothetical protein
MSKEILFRGQRTDNGEWVEGNIIRTDNAIKFPSDNNDVFSNMFIQEIQRDLPIETFFTNGIMVSVVCHKIIPSTVAQYIGMSDKNGKHVYPGCLLKSVSEIVTDWGRKKTGKMDTTIHEVFWNSKEALYFGRVINSDVNRVGSETRLVASTVAKSEIVGTIYDKE